jgi:predicted dithiol-disulfide oxidoreductase (DUF899 family)
MPDHKTGTREEWLDVTLAAVSRAPLAKLQAYKRRMGWSFPWASSFGSDFNFDFQVAFTKEQQQSGVVEYGFRTSPWPSFSALRTLGPEPLDQIAAAAVGTDYATYTREAPGMSAFVLEDGVVYQTYSTYARGLDGLWACTSGWTARHAGATRPASGTAATTSTTASDADRSCAGLRQLPNRPFTLQRLPIPTKEHLG